MTYVIQNREGFYYGGFQDGQPVWLRTRHQVTRMDESIADQVMRQMTLLGFTGLEKKPAAG